MGKKNGSFGKMYGKVVGKDSDERPGWKGPAFVKKTPKTPAPKKKTAEEEEEPLGPEIPVELQQLLLNIFRDSFSEVLTSDGLVPLLQAVKAALYERDFARKFLPLRVAGNLWIIETTVFERALNMSYLHLFGDPRGNIHEQYGLMHVLMLNSQVPLERKNT